MGKYKDFRGLTIPLSVAKKFFTTTASTSGLQATSFYGNEGIILKDWIQERIDEGDIDLNSFVPTASTNLSFSRTSTTVTILSDTGTDAILPIATTTLAGILTAGDKIKLDALPTLTGVASGSLNLGTFTGSIISDNVTIKAALQSLETNLDAIPSLTIGDLTSTDSAITVIDGTGAVVDGNTSITFNPSNVLLSTLGGNLGLDQLDTTGATLNDFIIFDGANFVAAAYTPSIPDHNDLGSIQGGTTNEYYHLTQSLYDQLTDQTADTLLGRVGTNGIVQELTLSKSIVFNTTNIELDGDSLAPGNTKFYGTNGSGTKGWYDATFTGVTSVSASDSADIDFTVTNPTTTPDITGILVNTGVVAGTYGSSTAVGIFTVNAKGRITSASNITISIPATSVTSLDEYIDDRINTLLVEGTNINFTYDDTLNTLTIDSTASLGSGTTDQVAYWLNSTTLTSNANFGFDGDYLTVGNPGAGSLSRITSKGTGATLSTYGYIHQSSANTEVFKVADNGAVTVGALGEIYLHPDAINLGTGGNFPISVSGGNLTLYSDTSVTVESGGTPTNTPSFKSIATRSTTIGNVYNAQIEGTFSMSSGSNRYTDLHVKTIVNQTGGTSPIRSIYIEPTLTAAITYVGLEINTPSHTALKTTAGNVSFTLGSDAEGDILYRNSSGNLARLGVGTASQILGSNGTVPVWTTSSGSLPGGSEGDLLMYAGGNWDSVTLTKEKQTGITGTAVTLAVAPITGAPFILFRNGVYQDDTDDYSVSGTSLTMVTALISTDKITAIYYIT